MDGQGRLLIPSLLRETAGVSGEALVLGQTDYLKLVDLTRHLESIRSTVITDEDYDELAHVLG
jgi:DNA-binding transcriptional regulator/RsmH inhibitor MraZ